MKYENYVFDLYGTLVDIHTDEADIAVWEKMTELYGEYQAAYEPEELRKCYETFVREEQECCDEIQIEKVFGRMFAHKGVKADDALILKTCRYFRKITTEYIRLYPWTIKMLETLKSQKKKIYLLSNAQHSFTVPELDQLGLTPYFDRIFISSDYGVKKPNAEFYQVLLDTCRVKPEECLMTGNDEICDILGARKVGMATFYIHSNISPEYTGKGKADYAVLENVEELKEIELP